VLSNAQQWFADLWPWIDFNYAQGALFEGDLTSAEWAHLGVTGLIWLVIPMVIGYRMVLKSEVK
jgi:ABC-2 type transport system permease protein